MAEVEMREFQELDGLLKCGICHETFQIPVITECSHSFCSLCIRKWLTTKQVCPACSMDARESSLRKNTIVENIVEALERVKKAKKRTPSRSVTQTSSEVPSNSNVNPACKLEKPNLNSSTFHTINSDSDSSDAFVPVMKDLGPSTSKASPQVNVRSKALETRDNFVLKETPPRALSVKPSENPSATPKVGLSPAVVKVACPVCCIEMPQRVINEHLDKCLNGDTTRSSAVTKTAVTPALTAAPAPSPSASMTVQRSVKKSKDSTNPPLEPITKPIKKMVYNLMPDAQLRKELKKYGLPTQGDRKTLAGRMQRYVALHNSECDATNPRTLEELKKHFEKEERALSGPSTTSRFSLMFKTKQPDEDEFEKARKVYIHQNNESFKNLIDQVRNRNKPKSKLQPEPVTLSDDEDDPVEVNVPSTEYGTRDSDSDSPLDNVQKTPQNHKNAKKNVKRKVQCIESESEDESDNYNRPEKRPSMEGNTSPVLVRKTPVRRELRSRVIHSKVQEKSIQKERKPKQTLKKGGTRAVTKSSPVKVVDSEGSDSLFDTPSSASSEIPCGQISRTEEEDCDALSQLVTLLDEDDDSGSTTDFEN